MLTVKGKKLSIDIGGTNIRVSDGQKIIKLKSKDFKTNFEEICQVINNFKTHIAKIGICCAGPLDLKTGTILNAPNLDKSWVGFSIIHKFKEIYPQAEIKIDNDANIAALGQYLAQNKPLHSLVYITFSTGIGAGLIIDGKVYHGFKNTAFEIANALPDYWFHSNGQKCGVEYFAGGNGLIYQAKEYGLVNDIETTEKVLNNPETRDIVENATYKIASLLSTIIYFINPEKIVIGGSVCLNNKNWFKDIIKLVHKTTKDINYQTPIEFAKDLDHYTLLACTKL